LLRRKRVESKGSRLEPASRRAHARYAPQLGRYIEPDPLGRLGSWNKLYVYVGDNPVNLTDPLGLCPLNKISCSSVLPNGQTVGQVVQKYRAELQDIANEALQNPENPNPLGEITGAFLATAQPYGPIDFKNNFSGMANAAFLGQAGNFAYYAIGSGILPTWELDAGAGVYAVLSATRRGWTCRSVIPMP
jgi:RHS repeat-associated protein